MVKQDHDATVLHILAVFLNEDVTEREEALMYDAISETLRYVAALATPSPEAAGSTEAPVASKFRCFECEGPLNGPYCPACNPEMGPHAFRAGIEAAAKVARAARFQSYGPQDHPERIAEAIEALAPPAGAGEKQ